MKRIWAGGSIEKGMSRRRDAEAKIIEDSLKV
jgi:GH24 family phage-related lysozyme (muramidase)